MLALWRAVVLTDCCINDESSHAIIRLRSDSFRWPKFAREVPSPKGQLNFGIHPDCHLYWLSRSTQADAGYGMDAKGDAGNDRIPIIGNAMMTWDSTLFRQHQSANTMEELGWDICWWTPKHRESRFCALERSPYIVRGALSISLSRYVCDDSYVFPVADPYLQVTFGTKDLRFRTRVNGREMAIVRKIPKDFFDLSSATFAESACM